MNAATTTLGRAAEVQRAREGDFSAPPRLVPGAADRGDPFWASGLRASECGGSTGWDLSTEPAPPEIEPSVSRPSPPPPCPHDIEAVGAVLRDAGRLTAIRWCRLGEALTAEGNPCAYDDDFACSWSLFGAVLRMGKDAGVATAALEQLAARFGDDRRTDLSATLARLRRWHEHPTRTVDDVTTLLQHVLDDLTGQSA